MERLLSSRNTVVAVHNAGNPGVGTDYALKYIHAKAKKVRPSAVVVGFFVNDFADNEGERYYRLVNGRLEPQNLVETFAFYYKKSSLARSAVYQWFCERSHALSLMRRWLALVASGGVGNMEAFLFNRSDLSLLVRGMAHANAVDMTRLYFAAVRDAIKSSGVPLLVAYIPSIVDVRTARQKGHITVDEKAWAMIMKDLDIDSVSFTPILANSGKTLTELYLNEGHWTALSHRLAAQVLAERLRRGVKGEGLNFKARQ
jgi:hypothetical protein